MKSDYMKKIIKFLFSIFIITLIPVPIQAREVSEILDWYIKDFSSEIIVNKDSSLDITENITAD